MGTYNHLFATVNCPNCGKENLFTIQYKHGDCWLYDYKIGDAIRWGGNDYFQDEHIEPPIKDYMSHINEDLLIEGMADKCPFCNYDSPEFLIRIEGNIIRSVSKK